MHLTMEKSENLRPFLFFAPLRFRSGRQLEGSPRTEVFLDKPERHRVIPKPVCSGQDTSSSEVRAVRAKIGGPPPLGRDSRNFRRTNGGFGRWRVGRHGIDPRI